MDATDTPTEQHPFIARIDSLCAGFAERAESVDTGGPANDLIRENLRSLAEIGFYGASVSAQVGGLGLPEAVKRECVERIAAACGATAFAQNQLHGGGGFIAGASSETLKAALLPRLCAGEIFCGVAFAHLRRAGGSPVTARRVEGGYVIDGAAPWVSDWSFLNAFVLGAAVETTGEMLFCYIDRHEFASHFEASPPMQLAVMTACDTVSVAFHNLPVDDEHVLQVRDPEHMERSDFCGITGHVTLPLGCARGSAQYLAAQKLPAAMRAGERLASEIDRIREESTYWNGSKADIPEYRENALRVRSEAVSVALRAAGTAIAASGGRAHLLTHPAQRRLREAAFYASVALTPDTQSALMETLTHAC